MLVKENEKVMFVRIAEPVMTYLGTVTQTEGNQMRMKGWAISPSKEVVTMVNMGLFPPEAIISSLVIDGNVEPFEGILDVPHQMSILGPEKWTFLSEWYGTNIPKELGGALAEQSQNESGNAILDKIAQLKTRVTTDEAKALLSEMETTYKSAKARLAENSPAEQSNDSYIR